MSIHLTIRAENGKTITCDAMASGRVNVIVWRKNGGVLLPLVLSVSEAEGLRTLLDKAVAIAKATGASHG